MEGSGPDSQLHNLDQTLPNGTNLWSNTRYLMYYKSYTYIRNIQRDRKLIWLLYCDVCKMHVGSTKRKYPKYAWEYLDGSWWRRPQLQCGTETVGMSGQGYTQKKQDPGIGWSYSQCRPFVSLFNHIGCSCKCLMN